MLWKRKCVNIRVSVWRVRRKKSSKKGPLGKKCPCKKVPGNMVPVKKKSPKKRSLLKEWPKNLPKEIEQFFVFYRLIPPEDYTRQKILNAHPAILYQSNCEKRAFFLGNFFHGDLFSKGLGPLFRWLFSWGLFF